VRVFAGAERSANTRAAFSARVGACCVQRHWARTTNAHTGLGEAFEAPGGSRAPLPTGAVELRRHHERATEGRDLASPPEPCQETPRAEIRGSHTNGSVRQMLHGEMTHKERKRLGCRKIAKRPPGPLGVVSSAVSLLHEVSTWVHSRRFWRDRCWSPARRSNPKAAPRRRPSSTRCCRRSACARHQCRCT